MNFLIFLPYLLLFPYACFGLIDRAQRMERPVESLFWSVSAALIHIFLLSTALALVQASRFWLLMAICYALTALLMLITAKLHLLYSPKKLFLRLKSGHLRALPALIVVAAFVLYALFPVSHLLGGRDSGLYPLNAIHISREGGIFYENDEHLNESYEEYKDIISLGYPGLYSNLDSFLNDPEYLSYPLGEFFENPEPGEINAQFMPGLSALLAVGYDIGGLPVMLRVNALVAVFCLLALYYFTRRFFGENAALFALLFLAICPAQIWAARITLTEILAQFLFFLACYSFAAGWERGQKSRSLLGGFFLGIGLMVRIDAYIYGLGLLFLTAYCAIFNRKALQYLRPGAALYALLGAFAMIWGLLFSRSYFTSHLESGSLKLIALANVLLLVLTGFLDILGALLAKKRPQKDWLCLMFASKKGALLTSLAFLAGFALLYFLRPILPHGEKASSIFASRSMIEFCWYISIPAVLLAIYGLYRFLRKRGEKVAILFVFFAIGISNLLVYLLWPSITPDHIWASRRWITVCIPFLLILAGYGLCSIRFSKCRALVSRAAQGVLCAAVCGYLLYQSSPFLFRRTLSGIADQYEQVAEDLDSDTVYFSHSTELSSYLRFVYGKQLYRLAQELEPEAVDEFLSSQGALHCFGAHPYTFLNPFNYQVTQESEGTISGLYLEQTISSYPRRMVEMIYPASTYAVRKPSEPIQSISLPLSIFSSYNNVSEDPSLLRSDGTERHLLFGPYLHLEAGSYTAEITLRLVEGSGRAAIVNYCAAGKVSGEIQLTSQDFDSSGMCTLRLPIALDSDVEDFELRVVSVLGTTLEISDVTLFKEP